MLSSTGFSESTDAMRVIRVIDGVERSVELCPPGKAEGAETAEDWVKMMYSPRTCACSHPSSIHGPDGCNGIGCLCDEFILAVM